MDRIIYGFYRILKVFYENDNNSEFGPRDHSLMISWAFDGMILHSLSYLLNDYLGGFRSWIFYILITLILLVKLIVYRVNNKMGVIINKFEKEKSPLTSILFSIIYSCLAILLFFFWIRKFEYYFPPWISMD